MADFEIVAVNIRFLTPITASDLKRQSNTNPTKWDILSHLRDSAAHQACPHHTLPL